MPLTTILFALLGWTPGLVMQSESDCHRCIESDTKLFELVVLQLANSPGVKELRVDPRPIRNDPALVTFSGVWRVIPERVSPDAQAAPLAEIPPAIIRSREAVLAHLQLGTTNVLSDARCPGFMIPPSPEVDQRKAELCPRDSYENAIIALPRKGGAYLPEGIDERNKYAPKTVYSVRVISRSMGPRGSVESSADFIFQEVGKNEWKLLERRNLLIVE